MKRSSIKGLKHNTKLDVRLPDQLKDEFLARCRAEGVSSGAVIRSMIIDYVFAQPRRLPVMAAGVKETIVKRSKWVLGGIGTAGAAVLSAMVLIFPPLATAEESLGVAYRLVASQEGGTTWRTIDRWQVGDGAFEPILVPELNLRIELQATDCATVEVRECSSEQAYILMNVWLYEGEIEASDYEFHSMGMRISKGHSGSIDTGLTEDVRLDAVFTPVG